jgi:hypothetical protein
LSCALLVSCIERPFDAPAVAPPRPAVDRAALQGVLLQAPPPDLIPVGALFGNGAELIGYKLEPPALVPNQKARLTLYWRCRAPLEAWHVFVHLDDPEGGRIHAEHDPANGRFPTDAWKPGDVIADPVVFEPHASPLTLYLGLYSQGETRLTLTQPGRGRDDGANRLFVGALPIAR